MSRSFRRWWVVAAGCLGIFGAVGGVIFAVEAPVEATGDNNPYAVIIDRNVFRLNPPLPPPPPPEAKPADLPQYKLTGIVKIGDQMRVLFALAPKDAKDLPTYLNLAAGERQGQLELVRINREKEEVDVINSGTAMKLSVASNSYASSGPVAAPAAAPGVPGLNGPRRLPGFPLPPRPAAAPAPAPAEVPAATAGSPIIIGGDSSSEANGGSNPNSVVSGGANYAAQNYGNYGGGSGVSVSGGTPVNYGGAGGATIATPNGTALNFGVAPANGQAAVWPPVEQAEPAVQAAELLAASQGMGPPMPPIVEKPPK